MPFDQVIQPQTCCATSPRNEAPLPLLALLRVVGSNSIIFQKHCDAFASFPSESTSVSSSRTWLTTLSRRIYDAAFGISCKRDA